MRTAVVVVLKPEIVPLSNNEDLLTAAARNGSQTLCALEMVENQLIPVT